MASIVKLKSGKYLAQVRIKDRQPISKTFTLKAEAKLWSQSQELAYRLTDQGSHPVGKELFFSSLVARYSNEVTPRKKGQRAEQSRLRTIMKSPLARIPVKNILKVNITAYRDERLKSVQPSSVAKELVLLSAIFTHARKEWDLNIINLVADVRKPTFKNERTRRLEGDEYDRLINNSDYELQNFIVIATETGMRRSEIAKISRATFKGDYVHLAETKNNTIRNVPLSTLARRTIEEGLLHDTKFLRYKPDYYTNAFHKLCLKLGIEDLKLHDLRHEACSRLLEKGLSITEVASISGHKTTAMLQRYSHFNASELAKKLG